MSWPFEHWDNGVCYRHEERWAAFRHHLDEQYPHNDRHRRIDMRLVHPRQYVQDIPRKIRRDVWGTLTLPEELYLVSEDRTFSVIFEPFPCWANPHSGEESYHVIAEDGHMNPFGEQLVIYSTDATIYTGERFCWMKGRYWGVESLAGGHKGPHPAPHSHPKHSRFFSIYDT